MADNIEQAAASTVRADRDPAKLMVDWARLQVAGAGKSIRLDTGVCDIPMDASQQVTEGVLRKMIGKWLRFQSGRGWKLVSDVHISRPAPAIDVRTGRHREGVKTYSFTGTFAASKEDKRVVERATVNISAGKVHHGEHHCERGGKRLGHEGGGRGAAPTPQHP